MQFKKQPSTNELALDTVIGDALASLAGHEPESEEYRNIVNQLTALNTIQETKKDRVSKDAMLNAAASLLGILAIVGHERAHVVTSKAIPFVKSLF